jgi:hypothetical protein
MHQWSRSNSVWLCVALAFQQTAMLLAQAVPVPVPRMNIAVVQGEAAIHNVREQKPVDVVVIVRDGNHKPVPKVSVTFTLPASGATASFANKEKALTVQSDQDGYAIAKSVLPNKTVGSYHIKVEATHEGQTAEASVAQFNMNSVSSSKGVSGKWIAIIAGVGAAAAGGVVIGTRSGGSSSSVVAPTPIGITPGTGTVGGPR